MDEELKPCPFCGGEAEEWGVETYSVDSSYDMFGCRSCGIGFDTGKDAENVKLWNTRHEPAQVRVKAITEDQLENILWDTLGSHRGDVVGINDAVALILSALEPDTVASDQTQADGWQDMNDDARKAGLVLVVTDEETFHTAYWTLYEGGTWIIAGTMCSIQPYKWRPLPPAPEKAG